MNVTGHVVLVGLLWESVASYSFSLSGNLVLNFASVRCEGVRCGRRGYDFHSHRIGLTCCSIQAM